jgi:hypothetical protein
MRRFISEDPIGLGGEDVNFFAYVWNDPIDWSDPEGLKKKDSLGRRNPPDPTKPFPGSPDTRRHGNKIPGPCRFERVWRCVGGYDYYIGGEKQEKYCGQGPWITNPGTLVEPRCKQWGEAWECVPLLR